MVVTMTKAFYNHNMHQSLEYYKGRTVIVTGAAGFIGSHLVDNLINSEARVIAIDNLVTGNLENLSGYLDPSNQKSLHPGFDFIFADVNQPHQQYLSEIVNADCIFHFASPASPPKYQEKPVETYLVNSWATHQLLDYLRHNNPNGRLIFASTSEAYGDPLEHPQRETYWGNVNPNGSRSCYDESKRLGETICGVHFRNFGVDTRIVRIFNTYGPRMDLHDGRVIPNLVLCGLSDQPMTIYGDGMQTRSYCYIDDLVEGILRAGAMEEARGETINLGNPEEFTILETASLISQVMSEHEPQLINEPLPKDDPGRRRPDISKAERLLGWEPKIDFMAGLKPTIEYFKHQFKNETKK